MKKLLSTFLLIFVAFHAFSQSDEKQVTIPKKIYIGDTVELQYSFYSGADLFEHSYDDEQIVPLNIKDFSFATTTEEYSILASSIKRNELNYILSIIFIPWKVGKINFPELDIAKSLSVKTESSFLVHFEAVEVSSIIQERNITSIRPSLPPLLLPGTMHVFYAVLLILVVLLIVVIYFVKNWQKIIDAKKLKQQLKSYEKNAKEAGKNLAWLEKNISRLSDSEFCLKLQRLIRRYLEFKFDYNFTTIATPQIMDTFETISAGLMTDQKQMAAMSVAAVLKRTDYIRYAKDSLDSKREPQEEFATTLLEEERASLLRITRDAVNRFEGKKQYA